jgi:hypothetical protein
VFFLHGRFGQRTRPGSTQFEISEKMIKGEKRRKARKFPSKMYW